MTRTQVSSRSGVRRLALLVSLLLVCLAWPGQVPGALADGPTTFSNTGAISIPATGSEGIANPYPSSISVSGMSGAVVDVNVTFTGLTHAVANDIDALVVAPTGANLVVFSDVAAQNSFTTASNANLTFDDSAATAVPFSRPIPSGTYKPTNIDDGKADAFPTPAPAASAQTTLAGAFTGINPNGDWKLYVVDDTDGDTGSLSGGWSLTITTQAASAPTTTTVTTSQTPSTTGSNVTFSATVTSSGSPVTTGTVQFSDGSTNLGGPVALNGAGIATVTTSALTEGTHAILASYGGASGLLSSNGSVSQRVDNATSVNGNQFCNTGGLTLPDRGAATPYPSNIKVFGLTGPLVGVTATLTGISHTVPLDFDIMLSGPDPTKNLVLMSDVGGQNPVAGVNITFDDAAASGVPSPLASGTFQPTDDDSSGPVDTFPAPAPTVSGATTLLTFDGIDPNGTWSLWVVDDATGDTGGIANGWCLTLETSAPTSTSVTSSVNPSSVGESVTFTATVTSGGSPVGSGSVQFSEGGTSLGSAVPVAADGTATLTTSSLGEGSHTIHAAYSGTGFAGSSDDVTQVVSPVATSTSVTSSVNPSSVGESVTFTATVTSGGSPVGSGSVQFSEGGTSLGSAVPVAADGTASLTTSSLGEGSHTIHAAYSGTGFAGSSDDVTQVVSPVVTTAHLTLLKSVVNDSGGLAMPGDWTLRAKGPVTLTGTSGSVEVTDVEVPAGSYTLSESGGPIGYTRAGWRCTDGTLSKGVVTLAAGDAAVCTVTNNDRPQGHLTLTARVINDNGRHAAPWAWTLAARGPTRIVGITGSTGVTKAPVLVGRYSLTSYGGPRGYAASGWRCTGATATNGSVVIRQSADVVCTITFNDRP